LLPSAHAIDREYRVMQALAGTDAPVPRMILFHAGREIVGTAFCLMERLAGERSRRWKGVRRIRHR
jgi:aminoglycoside phosphotransferase (APT) family kinase protein